MRDRVADVLSQRAALDRGTSAGVIASIVLHVALAGAVIYSATHAVPPQPAKMVSIEFANMPGAPQKPAAPRRAEARPTPPKIEEPKPVIEEPKPVVEQPVTKPPEKNTVPMSSFGRSTKKGSEVPAPAPAASTQPPATSTAPDIPIGGSGVTGIEGGDFPFGRYVEGINNRIKSNWFRPQISGAETKIYFRIQRDGKLTDIQIRQPSGNNTYDRAALSAVRSSSPVTGLPPQYAGTYLGVELTFR